MKLKDLGIIRAGAAAPKVHLADPWNNAKEIIRLIRQAEEEAIELLLFPELSTTGLSCGELFLQDQLIQASNQALQEIAQASAGSQMVIIVGAPIKQDHRLFSAAAVIQSGQILAFIAKARPTPAGALAQTGWFSPGREAQDILWHDCLIPFGSDIVLGDDTGLRLSLQITSHQADIFAPPGAQIVLNMTSAPATASAISDALALDDAFSQLYQTGHVSAAPAPSDSTSDVVFSGRVMVADRGDILSYRRSLGESVLSYAELDYDHIQKVRRTTRLAGPDSAARLVTFDRDSKPRELTIDYPGHPFIPTNHRAEYLAEVLRLQAIGLAHRLQKTGLSRSHIGVSGGLDSSWALIVVVEAYRLAGLPPEHIRGITLPGFGTSEETKANAYALAQALGLELREIDIQASVLQHFKDIGHDPADTKLVYENAQARERTQILMDLANKEHGLVIGTGDLSEIALGWSTYNGDHISMYSVNCSVPKTLLRALMKWYADQAAQPELTEVLYRILQTPISPELLPPDATGAIAQKTEDIIGDYSLNDFFLYHVIKYGDQPEKIIYLAGLAFGGHYSRPELKDQLANFYRRLISNQFKRNAAPDGPQVLDIGLSSYQFRLVSDAGYGLWLRQIEQMED